MTGFSQLEKRDTSIRQGKAGDTAVVFVVGLQLIINVNVYTTL
jgi:hypothetical protein